MYNECISPYSELLSRSGKCLLFGGRIRAIAMEAYKIVTIGPALLHENITTKESNLRDRYRAVQPNVRAIKYRLNSFSYNGAKINMVFATLQLILNVQPLKNILNVSFAIGTALNVHVELVFYVFNMLFYCLYTWYT